MRTRLAVAVLFLCLVVRVNAQPCAVPSFAHANNFRASLPSSSYQAMQSGDFNKDGKLDYVYFDGINVGIALGDGKGGFGTPKTAVVNGGNDIVVGDFNKDGNLDIAVLATTNDDVQVLFGDGAGNLGAPHVFSLPAGMYPSHIKAADLDGDGILDLVVLAPPGPTGAPQGLYELKGLSGGTFASATSLSTLTQLHDFNIGDINGDGKPDIVVSTDIGQVVNNGPYDYVYVLLNTGTSFAAPRGTSVVATVENGLVIADFNGDGKADIGAASALSDYVDVLIGDGTGGFTRKTEWFPTQGSEGQSTAVRAGDWDGDGKTDLLVVSSVGIEVFFNTAGTGTFANAQFYGAPGSGVAAVADFNGDGKPDVLVAADYLLTFLTSASGTPFDVPHNSPLGSTYLPATTYQAPNGASVMASGDFNGDGHLDLVIATDSVGYANNSLVVLLGDGHGNFSAPIVTASTHDPVANTSIAVGDFNKDGKLDVVLGARSDAYRGGLLYLGDGTGHFSVTTFDDTQADTWGVAGDFNRDGNLDFVGNSGGFANEFSILLGNGQGVFGPEQVTNFGVDESGMAAADLNGDGKLDLVIADGGGHTLGVFLGDGAGGFAAPVLFNTAGFASPRSVVLADFNGDGKLDAALATAGGVQLMLGAATGIFAAPTTIDSTFGLTNIAAGDFNGDGKLDLAVGSDRTADVLIFLGNGNGTFSGPTHFYPGGPIGLSGAKYPNQMVVGDFNEDGKTDIAAVSGAAPGMTLLLNDCVPLAVTLTSSVNPSTFGQSVTFTATANPVTTTGSVAFKDGTTTLSTVPLSSGVAAYATSALAVGSHSMTAVMTTPGGTATSSTLTQVVNKVASSVALVSSVNPSTPGQSVTFTVNVSPSSAAGSITFKDGATTLGTVSFSGGSASFATSALVAGTHQITASYGGSTTVLASTSATLSQVVATSTGPILSSIAPAFGPVKGGTTVTLTGQRFAAGATVTFGTFAATVTSLSATTIKVTTAAATSAGTVNVQVKNPDNQTSTLLGAFKYGGFDPNGDTLITAADIFYLVNYLFAGGPGPVGSGDANGDSLVTTSDIFYVVNYLFAGGPAPI